MRRPITVLHMQEGASRRNTEKETWQAPPVGFYKANWDAALSPKSGRIGMGDVERDHAGCSTVRNGGFYNT
jgi:hypothetical protein